MKMLLVTTLFLPALAICAARGGERAPALSVGDDGVLRRNGRPFRGIGVNYFDAFYRTLKEPADTGYRDGLAALKRLGIPFARFMACGFWPKDWQFYLDDRERYFGLLDGVVRTAEEHGIGLIPSLFWHDATVPDLVGEPRGEWGNPRSKTHAFMRQYVREVVMRYRASPAIWGWEFGNEYNLAADLPNAAQHRPPTVPRLGTPATRSGHDDVTHGQLVVAFAAFAREVRKHDPHRIISTGSSIPRPSAWHQWKERSWTQDTGEQFAERLRLVNPDPVDIVSIHVYPHAAERFGREVSATELVRVAMAAAASSRKPLFIGEFGAWKKDDADGSWAKARFSELLKAIEDARVPLAALWVYDFSGQGTSWNITTDNHRAYQLRAIAEANRRLRATAR